MEHGLKDIALYVQNTYNTLHSCHNFPAGSRQAARGACIGETSLFCRGLRKSYIEGLVQDCGIYMADTLEILQYYAKPYMCLSLVML